MSKHNIIKFDPTVPAKFAEWFGPPALLAAEDRQIHDRILCGFFHNVRPQDFIECMFIDDLAYNVCLRQTLRRRRDKVVRHANNEKFERLERELLADAGHRKEKLRNALGFDKSMETPDWRERQPQTKLAVRLEMMEAETNKQLAEVDAETNKRLAELQKAKDGPIDEAASFDKWIDAVERIDEELAVVEQNIRITLKLLDEHRTGLGPRLRQVADEIVDGEFAEVETPAREEAADGAESACSTKTPTALTEPTTPSTVAESPLPAPVKANGGGLTNLDAPAASVPPPRSSPAEQQDLKE
jgi:hypothetical protein